MSRPAVSAHYNKSKALDGKYMLGDEIGKGAYGRVYKGLDLENGDFVAIKQVSLENIPQEDLNIIMQEIDLLKNLNHKNIVKYLGSLKTKTHLHIILEYVENGSLANIIKPNKFGPFPESLVVLYISQVLEGLVYLHEQGVIHRDIKGANILTTKEGLVKLADFGVATKLNEADLNTHSVVGTPYWMAPEVIEMSGVCAASDIWSVGCTVIELLTCVPPYYDLQPMPALFRIVQDVHPPIPDGLSADITDFLHQCFKKDAMQRPDAKTLLLHPWIQNTRRALQSSLRRSGGTLRIIEPDSSKIAESSSGNGSAIGSQSGQGNERANSNLEKEVSKEELFTTKSADASRDEKHDISDIINNEKVYANDTSKLDTDLLVVSAQDPTLLIHKKVPLESGSSELSPLREGVQTGQNLSIELLKGDLKTDNIIVGKPEVKESSALGELNLFEFGPGIQEVTKVIKPSTDYTGDELSRFRDTPGDSSLDDLFHPLQNVHDDRSAEASTSGTSNLGTRGSATFYDGNNDLAATLKARIAQKRIENDPGRRNGGELLQLMMGAIDIDSSVFDDNLPGDNPFPLQAVEFSKLVGLLKPEESEDSIISACQKLISFFNQRPEQKHVFLSQHGFLSLMELLDVPKNRVICSVLQLINQIIKDNTNFQENACLIGLIPVVMSFVKSDRPREVRMQAAFFFQQLCQSSSLTLQMFIACRGIPVLVGFLEADYAKYREMVHLAIDGMWQVFKLQHSRNDFCRIAAKNGIFNRLVNTLHSLNEATRLATVSGGGPVLENGFAQRPRSGQLDYHISAPVQSEMTASFSGQLDPLKVRTDMSQPASKHTVGDMDKTFAAHSILDASVSSKMHDMPSENAGHKADRGSLGSVPKDWEQPDIWNRGEFDPHRQQRLSISGTRNSTDRPPKQMELSSNGYSGGTNVAGPQQEPIRPLLSLLENEPPSRHVSGQLEYAHHLSGLERHDSILPLLHASTERKTNGELDFLMQEFAEVSRHGKEISNTDSNTKVSSKLQNKLVSPAATGSSFSNDGSVSRSGMASQTASGVLSGSGVLNARPGSATSSGLLTQMVSNIDVAREYLEKVADLLLEFSRADSIVKSYMCAPSLLGRLFQMLKKIEPPILLKILKCINNLSTDPDCLESLHRADAIICLIPNLDLKEGPLISQIHNEVLNALFNLCKINKRRQEQAAENGIIKHLISIITSGSPLKQYALPLLCDMAHASRSSREQLREHKGLDIYLNLLEDELWAVTALDSLAVCLAHDNDHRKVEQELLKKESIQKLVKFFRSCPEQYFVHILEPFLKIITKSSRINTTLAVNGLTTLLIARLDHQDAIARLNLLKLIKAVYEHHPRPKQLIVENDLPQKLQNLIEERRDGQRSGGQVLVKQMATALLKALHINTVL